MIDQVPVGVWALLIFAGYFAGGGATVAYGSETDWFPVDGKSGPEVPPRAMCQSIAFMAWPVFAVGWTGYAFGRWLAQPPSPRPIPLPDEIKEKRP
jgi:hypothetical protein